MSAEVFAMLLTWVIGLCTGYSLAHVVMVLRRR
jgi:hypothetical protein